MTKHRPPLTLADALGRIAGELPGGYAEMAEVCDRATSTIYAWGNPDTDDDVPMGCAIRLDLAFQAAGGIGAPLYETYAGQLELAGFDRFAQPMALALLLPDMIRECGEAGSSVAMVALPNATPAHRRAAVHEIDQAIAKLQQARHQVLPPDEPSVLSLSKGHPSTGPPAADG